ncbi:MAG TPA: UDP-N-acetylmuramoyl-L-alanyl-D-glutamate--2,6-diaminopimelate ligase [Candidatus Saccharimonadales bacterium]|nr:UDP-N-acetylmuramoyl-L-alanyl-D-glutamate--2,6-diaminopimelate ligase [Candidatus Saccharimonadales bacterium]
MKEELVKAARRVLPKPAIKGLETVYRQNRARAVAAKYGYPARSLRVIAVTGTNGKTTTANYLNEILKANGHTTALFSTAQIELAGKKTLNDLNVTVATVDQMQRFFRDAKAAKADYVILEATSHALDQYKLAGVPIECAIMTNLTQDHLDYHGTMDNYAAAKAKLFKMKPEFVVLNRDDDWFDYFNQFDGESQKITYGTDDQADARITKVKLYKKGSEVEVTVDHQTELKLATALPGKFNVYNMSAAAAAAYLMHIDIEAIEQGVQNLEGVAGRFESIDVDKPYEVIVDYAHTPDALEKLLETIKSTTKNRMILVFGACGDRDKLKRPIMGRIAADLADRIVLTDEESYNEDPTEIRQMIMDGIVDGKGKAKTDEIEDRKEAIKKAMNIARKGDVLVITGMGHEQFRVVKGKKIPWNDGEVVRELAQK